MANVRTALHANLRPFELAIMISFSGYLRPSELLMFQAKDHSNHVWPDSGTGVSSCVRG